MTIIGTDVGGSGFLLAGHYGPEAMLDVASNLLINTIVEVRNFSDNELATLYTNKSKSTTAPNPTMTDSRGNLDFHAAPGDYSVRLIVAGVPQEAVVVTVEPDPEDLEPTGGVSGDLLVPNDSLYLHITGNSTDLTTNGPSSPIDWTLNKEVILGDAFDSSAGRSWTPSGTGFYYANTIVHPGVYALVVDAGTTSIVITGGVPAYYVGCAKAGAGRGTTGSLSDSALQIGFEGTPGLFDLIEDTTLQWPPWMENAASGWGGQITSWILPVYEAQAANGVTVFWQGNFYRNDRRMGVNMWSMVMRIGNYAEYGVDPFV